MKRTVRIGTRGSRLAVWQAEYVRDLIEKENPEINCEIITIQTSGDRLLGRSLSEIGGKGLFVKELDRALLDGRTDLSVHSLKDMPSVIPKELPVLAYSKREDPRDALILRSGIRENEIRVIATSSVRRGVQLQSLYPGCEICPLRGNVQTRLAKLEEGKADAMVLAAAGLKRLGIENKISRYFTLDEMIPSAGQGILAVQGRQGEDYSYLRCIDDEESRTAALAERSFVKTLDGTCASPIAAHAELYGDSVRLAGMYYSEEKERRIFGEISGKCMEAEELGRHLALKLKRNDGVWHDI